MCPCSFFFKNCIESVTDYTTFHLVGRDAFFSSPFYRHYAIRHLASDSAGCPSVAADVQAANTIEEGEVYQFREEEELNPSSSPSTTLTNGSFLRYYNVSRKGVRRGLLGASGRHSCFCGFEKVSINFTTMCTLPSYIQTFIRGNSELPFTADMQFLKNNIVSEQGGNFYLHQNERLQRTLRQIWSTTWSCPEMDPSDHWGIVRNSTAWIKSVEGSMINANDLLETGYGGFRVGTIPRLLQESKNKINPTSRVGTMNPSDGGTVTGQTKCQTDKLSMRPESLAEHFVDDLFPASQGVVDAAPVSHCMRYAIEVARLNVIAIVTGTNTTKDQILAQQSFIANSWKQKCAAQVNILGMCVSSKALDVKGGVLSKEPSQCAFRLDNSNVASYATLQGYITPGCLVYVYADDAGRPSPSLHDPCRYHACNQNNTLLPKFRIKQDLIDVPGTYVPFNVMDMVDPYEVRGLWPNEHHGPRNISVQEYDKFLKSMESWYSDLVGDLPGRITDTSLFRRSLLDEESGSGIGSPNTDGAGFCAPLKSAVETDTKYCDMMQDWWPGQFEYPVSFHPTAQCMSEDTSYRTFDRSFTMDYANHKMVYQPLAVRDLDFVHTHFGAEGLCRSSNIGVDMQVCLLHVGVQSCGLIRSLDISCDTVLQYTKNKVTLQHFIYTWCTQKQHMQLQIRFSQILCMRRDHPVHKCSFDQIDNAILGVHMYSTRYQSSETTTRKDRS